MLHPAAVRQNKNIISRKIILGITTYNRAAEACKCGVLGGKEGIFAPYCKCKTSTKQIEENNRQNEMTPLNESNIKFIYEQINDSIENDADIRNAFKEKIYNPTL